MDTTIKLRVKLDNSAYMDFSSKNECARWTAKFLFNQRYRPDIYGMSTESIAALLRLYRRVRKVLSPAYNKSGKTTREIGPFTVEFLAKEVN